MKVKLAILLFLLAAPALAQAEMTPEQMYGYKTFLRLHPPKEKPVKYNLYPHDGPVIGYGQDIPLCPALRDEATYENKTELKSLRHGKNGWLFRTIDFRTDFMASKETLSYLTRLNRLLASKGQTLVVAFQPSRAMASAAYLDPADLPTGYTPQKQKEGYKAFLKQLNDAGIIAPDLSEIPAGITYFPKGDFHWAPAGARDAALKISKAVKNLPAYDDLPEKEFESKITGLGPADRGAFEEFLQSTCKVNIELTSEPYWQSTGTAGAAEDLLGDGSAPGVTLLGTSNSSEEQKFNFAGFLRQYLNADVYNAAVLGGGFGSSSFRYYASDEYRQQPPKIVVWEFLPQHNYNNAESLASLRQMIPAVQGACEPTAALATYKGPVTAEKSEIFKKLPAEKLRNAYLYMHLTAPADRDLKLEILYSNGDADQVDLTRSARPITANTSSSLATTTTASCRPR